MKTASFKRLILSRKGGAWGSEKNADDRNLICIRVADFDYPRLSVLRNASTVRSYTTEQSARLVIKDGDILIEKSGGGEKTPVGRAVLANPQEPSVCSNFIERLRVDRRLLDPAFGVYVLAAAYQNQVNVTCIKQTTGIQNLDVDAYLSAVQVPLLILENQRLLVEHLTQKNTQINDAIASIRTTIAKLKEYRQSLITQAVTKGINQDMKRFPSVPFSLLFKLRRGLNITRADYVDTGVPCLSYGDVHSRCLGFVDPTKNKLPKVATDFLQSNPQCLLEVGDFVFADTSEDYAGSGDCSCVLNTADGLFAGYHTTVAQLRKHDGWCTRYLGYFFLSDAFRLQVQRKVSGIKVFSITNSILNATRVLMPPFAVQEQVADFLDAKCRAINESISSLEQTIERLTAYRQSLITEIVTKGLPE